jgi:hypothetical protein
MLINIKRKIKLIEILELKEGLIHLFWGIMLKTSNNNVHDDNKLI